MRYLLALLLLAACSSSTSPSAAAPRLGRYAYSFSAQGLTASGTMVLTYSASDSIAGHFEVSNYQPTFDLGFLNIDAYEVYAHPTAGGLAQHRFQPDQAGSLSCVSAQWWLSPTDIRSASCSVIYQGP